MDKESQDLLKLWFKINTALSVQSKHDSTYIDFLIEEYLKLWPEEDAKRKRLEVTRRIRFLRVEEANSNLIRAKKNFPELCS